MKCGIKIVLFVISLLIILINRLETPVHAYQEITVENGGELSGMITFKDKRFDLRPLKVLKDSEYCGTTVPDDSRLINASNDGLKNVVISLEGIVQGKKQDMRPIILNIQNCRFAPRVQAAMIGSSYEIRNLDAILHNTHFRLDGNTFLNVIMPASGQNIRKQFTQTGIIEVNCDAHSFMKAILWVIESPYFAVTDETGFFRIADIPQGKYRVKIWHEKAKGEEKEVIIPPSGRINLSLKLD